MATSGKFVLVADGYQYQVQWTAAQSVENNTSTITCTHTLICSAGYDLYIGTRKNTCTVDGVTVEYTSPKISTAGNSTHTLGTTVHTVAHDAATGTKTVTMTGVFNVQATISGSYRAKFEVSSTQTLDTIPRKSTISASNGTLGTAQTLTVSKKSSGFTHTVTYKCGSASGTICTKSSSTSLSWTPPLTLANQNTTGTSVPVTLTVTTYNGSTSLGSTTASISCSIPTSVAPSVSIEVSDPSGCLSKYGKYVQGKSWGAVKLTTAGAYGSTIKSHSVTFDGKTYTEPSFSTEYIQGSGSLTMTAKVTDSRGRSATASVKLTVLAYAAPTVSLLKVVRCDANGTENGQGEYAKVTFSGKVTPLDNKNTAVYKLWYKKTSESDWSSYQFDAYANNYTATNVSTTFAADTGASYDIQMAIADALTATTRSTVLSTGFTLLHWKADGTGLGIGKMAEHSKTLDMGVDIDLNGHKLVDPDPSNLFLRVGGWDSEEGHHVDDLVSGATYAYGSQGAPAAGVLAALSPDPGSFFLDRYALQLLGGSSTDSLYYRNLRGDNGWGTFHRVLTEDNIGGVTGIDADKLDGYHADSFARQGEMNNLLYSGDEFNFVPSGYAKAVWFNWQTVGGSNGAITDYHFCDGAGGYLASLTELTNYCTPLWTGSISSASTITFPYDATAYKSYVIVGNPGSASALTSLVVPVSVLTASTQNFQLADDGNYTVIGMYYANGKIYLVWRESSRSGIIRGVYGIR